MNVCSINGFTIDAICGSRRKAIIDTLRPPVPNDGGGRSSMQKVNPYLRTLVDDYVVDVDTLELPYMQVTVEISGQVHAQTLERGNEIHPLINVFNVKVSDSVSESVNITDIQIKVL